jgi:hypothetical protein
MRLPGYSNHHKGYRCLDLSSNRIIISRHVIFDEAAFPFADRDGPRSPATFEFLDTPDTVSDPIGPQHKVLPAGILPGDPGSSTATTGTSAPAPKDPMVPPLVPAPAPYVPPGRRVPTSPMPRAASTPLPTPRAGPSSSPAASSRPDCISLALRTAQMPRAPPRAAHRRASRLSRLRCASSPMSTHAGNAWTLLRRHPHRLQRLRSHHHLQRRFPRVLLLSSQ